MKEGSEDNGEFLNIFMKLFQNFVKFGYRILVKIYLYICQFVFNSIRVVLNL